MKVLIASFIVSLLLLLSITAAGSISMAATQNSYFSSDRVITLWGSLEVEDIETLAAYNDSRLIEFKQSWSKGNLNDTDWQYYNMFLKRYLYYFHIHLREISEKVGAKGAFLIQCWVNCSSSLNEIKSFTYRVAKDGEDLVSYNVVEEVWVAGNAPHSQDVQRIMQKDTVTSMSIHNILIFYCPSLALTYSTAGKEAYSRKIQPQVYITRKSHESETEVICMVTGFYPKPINVSLWKENKMADVMSTGALPNGDGTYQLTVLTTINMAVEQSIYCQVEHSSLKEPLIVHLDEIHHTPIGLVVGITVAVIVCVIGLVCFMKLYKKHRRYTFITGLTMD
ncbi:antigen-presenting glycoprotein CD1d-like [Aquarana catesbeiana]|uniref:antigen-presenting glycoprotein CD1d-like n=1 Tax=Aquarana catesbeiana TaxID=8400 RepID=UPI003CC99710